jgi:hypothetical protein
MSGCFGRGNEHGLPYQAEVSFVRWATRSLSKCALYNLRLSKLLGFRFIDVNSWRHFPVYKTFYGEENATNSKSLKSTHTFEKKKKIPTGMMGPKLNKWRVSENQNWAWMWTILEHLLVKTQTDVRRLRHVLRVAAQWRIMCQGVFFCCYVPVWHWPIRGKVCVCCWWNHTWSGENVYVWHITDVNVLNICEGYWIFWLKLFAVFHYLVIVSSCCRFTASSKTSSSQSEILCFFFFFFFKFQYLLFYSRSSNSFLRLLTRLLFPSIFTSISCCGMQFLTNMWPFQLAFLRFIVY